MASPFLKASPEGLRPQARVGAQPPKAALSAETEAAASSKGFPFGGSCRPQAADEGKVRIASLLTGNLRRLSPHPSAGGAADTFPQGGRHHAHEFSAPTGKYSCFMVF